MNKQLPVRQAIKAYYKEKTLSQGQLDALQHTLNRGQGWEGIVAIFKRLCPASTVLAASFVLFAVLLTALFVGLPGYFQPPGVIADAYADIHKDGAVSNGLQASMVQWMDESGIAPVPDSYPVQMSKFCRLNQYLTTHLRIAGARQGVVHLFFHHGERPFEWRDRSGVMDEMNWKLVKVRDNLTLIVLYSHDMREQAVQHIIGEMLPELQV